MIVFVEMYVLEGFIIVILFNICCLLMCFFIVFFVWDRVNWLLIFNVLVKLDVWYVEIIWFLFFRILIILGK